MAPESSAPSAGGRLSQRVLQAFKAAGKQGDAVGLLGLKSNRTFFGLVCGTKWRLVLDSVGDLVGWFRVLLKRDTLVCKLVGVGLVLTLFTNFDLQINRPLPISQSTALSQMELSPGLHHFIHR